MQKKLALVLSFLMLLSSLAACDDKEGNSGAAESSSITTAVTTETMTEEERAAKYSAAVAALEDDELTEDGTYTMSEDLVNALKYAEFTEPKNIIFMIGDGMGYNQLEGAETYYIDELYEGKMAWRYLPIASTQSSSSADSLVTDSAAGGTALSTGFRTANDVVGKDINKEENYKNVLEVAGEKGLATGIISTKVSTDATPASYTAHVTGRSADQSIALQQATLIANGHLDLILGSGVMKYEFNQKGNVMEMLNSVGGTLAKTWDEAVAAPDTPLIGSFCKDNMDTTDPEMPTLAEMTDLALDRLSKNEEGFFLMVEGSQIDSFGHSSELEPQFRETYYFDCAIAVALRFAAMNPDTVIIITADHETGGLILPADPKKDTILEEAYYTTGGTHSEVDVPVLAIGHGVEALEGINHNTDCARFTASLLGEDEFGQEKTVHTLLDTDEKENVTAVVDANSGAATAGNGSVSVKFDSDNATLQIPAEVLDISMSDVTGPRTVVMTFTNTGDTAIVPPALTLKTADEEVSATGNKYWWIEAGETLRLSYLLDTDCWDGTKLEDLESLIIGYADGESAQIEISDIYITERPMGK